MVETAASIAVIHLVWQGAGFDAFQRFVDSYERFEAGAPHDLIIGVKGFDGAWPAPYTQALQGIRHQIVKVPSVGKDICAYYWIIDQLGTRFDDVLLLNSSSEFLAPNWLSHFQTARGFDRNTVVGATGSFEASDTVPDFPNPHLRTNGIFADLGLLRRMDWGVLEDGNQFEAGPRSLTRQVTDIGGQTLIIDRKGKSYPPEAWPESSTFRAGGQQGLLVADNRTRAYNDADDPLKVWLHLHAWVAEPPGPHPHKRSLRAKWHHVTVGRRRAAKYRDKI